MKFILHNFENAPAGLEGMLIKSAQEGVELHPESDLWGIEYYYEDDPSLYCIATFKRNKASISCWVAVYERDSPS